MAHHTGSSVYERFSQRINKFPQGAPPSKSWYKILKILFSEKEAELLSLIPLKPFKLKQAAAIWNKSEAETQGILNALAERGNILDLESNGERTYLLPPPMAGFLEFSLMRVRNDIDQKILSELIHQYLNVEEDFVRELFAFGGTPIGRVFVNEKALAQDNIIQVLDYERASDVIKTADHIGVGVCYCRHKMQHIGKQCDAPMDVCLTFNSTASSLIKHNIIRPIGVNEGLEILHRAYEHNLVQFGENVRQRVNYICNCCGCCCEAMLAAKRFAFSNPVSTTNYLPVINEEKCSGCGKCVEVCPVGSMSLVNAFDPQTRKKKKARVDDKICLGCAVCVRNCRKDVLSLTTRREMVITPINTAHRTVMMAIEKGCLNDLIFDSQVLYSHRALSLVLGVILKMPPLKQLLAIKQVKSRYLEYVISKMKF
jgi:NAD-dependent dihydropyrimidine dehydrogenase PreA subunit